MFGWENEDINLLLREICPSKAQILLAIIAPTLLLSKSIVIYKTPESSTTVQDQGAVQISGDTSCSSALVTENMFMGARRHQNLAKMERLFYSRLGWALDMFVGDKEDSSLEIVMLVPIKARDHFPQIQKKTGPMMNLEATRTTAVAITGSEEEELAFRKGAPSQKERGRCYHTKPYQRSPAESKRKVKVYLPSQNWKSARGASSQGGH